MAQKEFTVDTRQLELLSAELAAMPKDVLSAMRSSLVTGVRSSLTKEASRHYAIDKRTLGGTFRVFSHRTGGPSSEGMQFEVSGRRLTLAHFRFSPQRSGDAYPTVEIIRGRIRRASSQPGADGKLKPPFVGETGAKDSNRVTLNVFQRTGRYSKKLRDFQVRGRTFKGAKREAIRSYRTVSVPQMLGHPSVARDVQDNLLRAFDRTLLKRIETRTGLIQQNIRRT